MIFSCILLYSYRCHGQKSCSIPRSTLLSYVQNLDKTEEQDCPLDLAQDKFRLKVFYESDILLSEVCPDGAVRHLYTCYSLSPVLPFADARDWCMLRGGDLSFKTPEISRDWINSKFNVTEDPWVIAKTDNTRPVLPSVSSSLLQPMKLGLPNAVYPCIGDDCQEAPGLCSFPLESNYTVAVAENYHQPCSDVCVNGGVCWQLPNSTAMCDCPSGFCGALCELSNGACPLES